MKRFSEQFGEIQGPATRGRDETQDYPEIDILSNLKEKGQYIGSPDAGQDWHTDMTYREVRGFVNVHAAYEALSTEIKTRLDGMTATHNIEKFWEHSSRCSNARQDVPGRLRT